MPYEIPEWAKSVSPSDAPKLDKACKPDLTPLEFDSEIGYAEFSSRHGYYRTTLNSCYSGDKPCGGGYPCKHMYRLAMKLGLIPGEYKDDLSKIKYQRFGVPLSDAVSRTEAVSHDSQKFLLENLEHLRNHPLDPSAVPSQILSELESTKLLVRVDEPQEIRMHPDIDKSSFSLLIYLRRKFVWSSSYDEHLEIFYYPYGSRGEDYYETISPGGVRSSSNPNIYHFPDDEITQLLTQYGHNRCGEGFDVTKQGQFE